MNNHTAPVRTTPVRTVAPEATGSAEEPTPPTQQPGPGRSDRLTMAAGWSLLAIGVLHTVVFAPNPWWGEWLTGMFRTTPLPAEAQTVFWALPGSFVVPVAVLAAMIIGCGRRGRTAPAYVAPALVGWAALCIWIVGPSGFLTVLVPATLMVIAQLRARRTGKRVSTTA